MNNVISKIVGGVLLLAGVVAMVALSAVPYRAEDPGFGTVRLSWRYRVAPNGNCRTRTQEELDALPVHMRTPEVCERGVASYQMTLDVDGESVFEDVIRPAGATGDRPLYVHRDLQVAEGVHQISVRFVSMADGVVADGGLSFDREVVISPGEVVLVTYNSEADRLEVAGTPRGG